MNKTFKDKNTRILRMTYHYITPANSELLSHLKYIWEKDGIYYITNDPPQLIKNVKTKSINAEDINKECDIKRTFDDSHELKAPEEYYTFFEYGLREDYDDSYMLFQQPKQPLKMARTTDKLDRIIKVLSVEERNSGSVEIDGNTWTFPKLTYFKQVADPFWKGVFDFCGNVF
jgi:hypothetical protein